MEKYNNDVTITNVINIIENTAYIYYKMYPIFKSNDLYGFDDLVQELSLHIFSKNNKIIDAYDQTRNASFSTYIITIISNKIKDITRKLVRKQQKMVILELFDDDNTHGDEKILLKDSVSDLKLNPSEQEELDKLKYIILPQMYKSVLSSKEKTIYESITNSSFSEYVIFKKYYMEEQSVQKIASDYYNKRTKKPVSIVTIYNMLNSIISKIKAATLNDKNLRDNVISYADLLGKENAS
ncbi:MAG: hypothetical protein LBV51_02720 [Acholeplasmatales bacterium]|jgi:RNA polymerase sigma factor (sigma-70 family)|nr:hypothetical protein [Acholeplasmatales bacterium]